MWFLTLLEAFSSTTQAKDLLEFIRGGKVINKYTDDNFKQALKAFLKYEFKTKQINLIKKEFNKININKNISKTLQNNKNTLKRDYLKALGIPNKIEQIHFKYFDEWDNEILSSSWLIAGSYSKSSKTLEITTIKAKSYIYPNVDKEIWNKMKNAIGKNGTGAGSIFWNYYLKPNGWLKSNKRKYIKENVSKKFYSYWNITPIGISKTLDKKRHIAKKIHSLDSIFNKKVGKKHGRII